ncbi:hypothetical protein N9R79_12280 [Vibrio sp.]|nr:hypothetical protein [Vibrio sp.]
MKDKLKFSGMPLISHINPLIGVPEESEASFRHYNQILEQGGRLSITFKHRLNGYLSILSSYDIPVVSGKNYIEVREGQVPILTYLQTVWGDHDEIISIMQRVLYEEKKLASAILSKHDSTAYYHYGRVAVFYGDLIASYTKHNFLSARKTRKQRQTSGFGTKYVPYRAFIEKQIKQYIFLKGTKEKVSREQLRQNIELHLKEKVPLFFGQEGEFPISTLAGWITKMRKKGSLSAS